MIRELYFESRGEVDTEMPKLFEGNWQDRITELKAKNEKFERNLKKQRDDYEQKEQKKKNEEQIAPEEDQSKDAKNRKGKSNVINYVGNVNKLGEGESLADQKNR